MSDRNASKQKRAAQNKAQREALAARRASVARKTGEESASSKAKAKAKGRGRPSTSSKPRATTPGAPKPSRWGDDDAEYPGRRAAITAFALAIIASVLILFFPMIKESAAQKLKEPNATTTTTTTAPKGTSTTTAKATSGKKTASPDKSVSLWSVLGPKSLLWVAVPIVASGVAAALSKRPRRRRVFLMCTVALGAYGLLMAAFGPLYLVALGSLALATWQASREERRLMLAAEQAAGD